MKAEILALIRAGGPRSPEEFEAAALALFRWQVAHNAEYAAFAAGVHPERWVDIPAVPVGLFRELALTCFPPSAARVAFHTSGTTGAPGVHRLMDTEVYDLGAASHAVAVIGPIPTEGVSLVSPAPTSSLGHMCRSFAPRLRWYFTPELGLDAEGAVAALRAATRPQFVPATAFALAELIAPDDAPPPAPVRLPRGSVVMVTGGFKGRRRAVDEGALVARASAFFEGAAVVGEYGMTELSSQLWAANLGDPYVPPPWMRVYAADPLTGEPAEEGVLRFVDLANHGSVLAIETQDLGRVLPDGRVQLLGRSLEAPPRGCSLTVEEAGARGVHVGR